MYESRLHVDCVGVCIASVDKFATSIQYDNFTDWVHNNQ